MENITEILQPLLDKYDVISYNFTQKNKQGSIVMKFNKPWEMNQVSDKELEKDISNLEIVDKYLFSGFRQGKRTENIVHYNFNFFLKDEYYDGLYSYLKLKEFYRYIL